VVEGVEGGCRVVGRREDCALDILRRDVLDDGACTRLSIRGSLSSGRDETSRTTLMLASRQASPLQTKPIAGVGEVVHSCG
jgi:hypothetical protein